MFEKNTSAMLDFSKVEYTTKERLDRLWETAAVATEILRGKKGYKARGLFTQEEGQPRDMVVECEFTASYTSSDGEVVERKRTRQIFFQPKFEGGKQVGGDWRWRSFFGEDEYAIVGSFAGALYAFISAIEADPHLK